MSSGGQQEKLFGHPTGLYTLFFAEMWERFSYYGMRALLVFYMIKGFLGYGDSDAYGVYGAYTALVYMTPFFGGMLADRLLGQRRAVVLGGLLMSLGHLTMTLESELTFFLALAMLIAGNGFFKPNISTMVGTLYPDGSPKRDGGFIIFYMGVNLGASMAPLLCGYVGETYGWHYGFGLATIGMMIGLAVFVAPTRLTQTLIGLGALVGTYSLFKYVPDNPWSLALNAFVAVALLASGIISCMALGKGGLPKWAGAPPKPEELKAPGVAGVNKEWTVYLATFLLVPIIALFVSGFSNFNDGKAFTLVPQETIDGLNEGGAASQIAATVVGEVSKPAGLVLTLAGLLALVYLTKATFRLDKIRRERMFVVLILTFFSMLFWSFFEQAGSSINNFTDRNVDRVGAEETVAESQVGETLQFQPTQLQLGYTSGKAVRFVDPLTGTSPFYFGSSPAMETLEIRYQDWPAAPWFAGLPEEDLEKVDKAEVREQYGSLKINDDGSIEQKLTAGLIETLDNLAKAKAKDADGKEPEEVPAYTIEWTVTESCEGMQVDGRSLGAGDVGQTIRFQPKADLHVPEGEDAAPYTTSRPLLLVDPASDLPVHFAPQPALAWASWVYDDRDMTYTLDVVDKLRDFYKEERTPLIAAAEGTDLEATTEFTIDWLVRADNVGMGIADRVDEVPASTFQAVNAICILIFGLVFTGLWGFLAARKKEPSTPFKFASGLLQLGLGFVALWWGAENHDERGMVHVFWLVLGYMLHTTGELCLSPVGLSMVTKLSPKILVSTVMGNWFLATAFSQYLAAIISQFTGVSHGGDEGGMPVPNDTVHIYGGVFGKIAVAAIVSALICFALTPLLKKWVHEGEEAPGEEPT